ncbi:MAG: ABC transporter permease [Acidobacteria bacterium]|nr:ABC transporter permease [Acidobacteriota bacterium]
MPLRDSFLLALESLRAHKLRSFLTLLGVLISVTTLVSVVSIIRGMDRYITEQAAQLGPDVFLVSRFGIITNARQWVKAQRRPKLTVADYEALQRAMTLVSDVGATLGRSAEVSRGGQTIRAGVRGVTPNMIDIRTESLAAGRYVSQADDRYRRAVCVIGQDVAKDLFQGRSPLGQFVRLDGQRFQVIGLAERVGSVFGQSQDNFVYIPLSAALKLLGPQRDLTLHFRVPDPEWMTAAQDEAKVILRSRHHLAYSEEDDFGMITPVAVMELWESLTGTISRVATVVMVVFVLIGGIVIMNIMLATVTERTWEIGMRKAVGAKKSDVRIQFLVESACLSTCGGMLGVLLAFGASLLVARYSPVPAQFALATALQALAISVAVGLVFGVYPASRAAAMDPIVALRAETG